jgi:hypothetical protein
MPTREPHESTLGGGTARPFAVPAARDVPRSPALVLVWSQAEPARIGELFSLPRGGEGVDFTIGRAVEPGDDGRLPLMLQQLRPFSRIETGPLRDARVSRRHLGLRLLDTGELLVERLGRGALCVNGHPVDQAIVQPGDVIEAVDRFSLLFTSRPAHWPGEVAWWEPFPFGAADSGGIVGESTAAWELRRQLWFAAPRREHVLVHGPSGAGKELVVRALHARSARAGAPLVARNAATIPEALVDAELFGNLRDYPNPGMPDRVGLFGEAHGGALFLDEVGELPHALQAHLLRVMDSGEYQRLGERQRRTSDARLFGATNRSPAELKHDLLARFVQRVRVPGLDERPEDAPLLARHLLRRLAADDPALRARFFVDDQPQTSAAFNAALVRRPYVAHARELSELLWRALMASPGPCVDVPPDEALAPSPPPRLPQPYAVPAELTREEVIAALEACHGVREQAWRLLRLRSRDQLKRLLKKLDIA